MKISTGFAAACLALAPPIQASAETVTFEGSAEDMEWREGEITLPPFPKDESLIEFYAGPTAHNRFSIDASSLNVDRDGVVRYVLVVKTASGATNVTFEGIRCSERRYKLYASGHDDGTWSKVRRSDWVLIENKSVNGHHAVLNHDFFCPAGSPIATAAEGREALRRGNYL